jgi:hypothetical protein
MKFLQSLKNKLIVGVKNRYLKKKKADKTQSPTNYPLF